MLSQATIDSFQNDGIAFIPGLFKAHLDSLRMGVQKNIEEPGPYAAENLFHTDSTPSLIVEISLKQSCKNLLLK